MFFMPPMSLGLTRYSRAGGIPSWVTPGPDGTLPVFDAYFAAMKYYVAPYGLHLGPDGLWPAFDASFYRSSYFLRGNMPFYTDLDQFLTAAGGTFSRGSDATYFDASGILRTAGPNVLRLDHDPVSGEALGALLEGGSTRETNYPIGFDGWSLWTGSDDGGNSLVRNAGLAPDGTMTASQLTAGDEIANGLVLHRFPGIVYSARRTRMICVKEGTYRYARLSCFTGPNARHSVQIDLRTGVLTRNAQFPDDFEVGVVALPNGWWLLWLDHVAVESARTDSTLALYVTNYIANADAGWQNPANKPAPGEYIWVWGGSMQTGIPSSLILGSPTGSTTRLADSLTFARAAPPEGTVVIEARTAAGYEGGKTQCLFEWSDTTNANLLEIRRINGALRIEAKAGGATAISQSMGVVADSSNVKLALSFRAGLYAVSLNGASAITSTFATPPADLGTLVLGGRKVGGSEWFGTFARLGVFDRAYTPAELQEMSS